MRPPTHVLVGRCAVVFLALWLAVAGCGPTQPSTPGGETPSATKTAKATFTPSGESATATLVPTITPAAEAVATTPTARAPKPLHMNSPEYGVQTFPWWRPEVASRDMQIAREAGFTWLKVGFGWRDIEGAGKGLFDWSRTDRIVQNAAYEGLDLLVRIDHQPEWAGGGYPVNGPPDSLQDLADFMTATATRYKGQVRAYQIWNEPNLGREWGGKTPNPDEYARLLQSAYAAVKAADPNAMVISAGLTPTGSWDDQSRPDDWYLESLYVAMGSNSTGYFDVLGAHAPGYKSPPERDPAEVVANPDLGGHRAFSFRRIEDLRDIMVKYGDGAKQVAILEFGWSSDPRPESPYNWHRVTEEEKADYIVRAYRYAQQNWSPWVGLMSLIYISDPEWTTDHEQYWWAITDPSYPEFTPRPAYLAIKEMPK
ncbi:MAG: cellulase family glycosylhydrolase [Anaerolineae bacterium]